MKVCPTTAFGDPVTDFNPLVSIIIPVYNGSDFLREAIDSALEQTYGNIEIVVVNDGSRDDGKTEAVALSYGDKIRYIRKANGGVATALNVGIREMKGDYFTWLSHDDLYYPTKTEEQVRLLEELGEDAVIYGDFEYIDGDGNFLGTKRTGLAQSCGVKFSLIMEGTINGCTVMVPRHFFDKVGLFDDQLRTTQDFDMWFRLGREYLFVRQAQPLVKSRVHPNQGSLTIPSHLEEQNALYIKAIEDFKGKDLPQSTGDTMASFYLRAAIRLVSIGCNHAADHAVRLFWKALKKDSFSKRIVDIFLLTVYMLLRTAYRNGKIKIMIKRTNKFITSLR